MDAFALLFAAGNLCAGAGADPRYDARRMVHLLIAGLRQQHPAGVQAPGVQAPGAQDQASAARR
jgi:hypothetical protein